MGKRQSFTAEFKQESALLILEQNYTVKDACSAMGVGETAMRRWVKQLQAERKGDTPMGARAITLDQQTIQELQKQIRKLEREKDILKKASALLMLDNYH